MTALAILSAGLAAWLLAGPAGRALVRRLEVRPSGWAGARRWRAWLAPGAVLVAGAGLLSAVGAWLTTAALAGGAFAYLWSRRRAEAAALAAARDVAQACRVIDSLLSQGHVPLRALIAAAEDCPVIGPAAAVARLGSDVTPMLRELGARPGAGGLLEVARAWEVTERTGAPLHGTLVRVKASLAAQAELAAVIAQELAAPRATGQILAVLPVVGLGLGYFVGGDPIDFLTVT
ncbi:MAG: hypothetical protein LBH76_03630, partial [Propionibacteriaceae bacterium]|nr:hypothetical protein [Propionibacteriaceae bacterium]